MRHEHRLFDTSWLLLASLLLTLLYFPASAQQISTRRVATAGQFAQAFADSVQHVVVTSHLDLTNLPSLGKPDVAGYSFNKAVVVNYGTASVRGNCTAAPPAGLDPQPTSNMCHVLVSEDLMDMPVNATVDNVWLDNLYIQVRDTPVRPESDQALLLQASGPDLWITGCILHGDSTNSIAMDIHSGRQLYMRDSVVTKFKQWFHPGIRARDEVTATLFRVKFIDNVASKAELSGVSTGSYGPAFGMQSAANPASRAWMYNCEFSGNVAGVEADAASDNERNTLYSNTAAPRIWVHSTGGTISPPNVPSAGRLTDGRFQFFPTEKDSAFQAITQEQSFASGLEKFVPELLPVPGTAEFQDFRDAAAKNKRMIGGLSVGALAGIIVGCLVAASLVSAAAVYIVLKQKSRGTLGRRETINEGTINQAKKAHDKKSSELPAGYPAPGAAPDSFKGSDASAQSSFRGILRPVKEDARLSNTETAGLTAFSRSTCTLSTAPAQSTSAMGAEGVLEKGIEKERMPDLEDALDDMHDCGEPFMCVYQVEGPVQRRKGGQGVVQFARRIQNSSEYAIKFFSDSAAFSREMQLYKNPTLRGMMPAVAAIQENVDGQIRSSKGYVFPPFIVVEKGESLNEWAQRVAPDFVTSLFVLCHVTKRLHMLHQAGICHRDLKPGNILWRPTANAWTLIDFGCSEEIGSQCRIVCSLHHAAPEIAYAVKQRQRTGVADPKVDIWALGVVAFSLLTGTRVFAPMDGRSVVFPYLLGEKKFPWEDPEIREPLLKRLGKLRRTVLACLSRNPATRPTSGEVLRGWTGMFEDETQTRTGLLDVNEGAIARFAAGVSGASSSSGVGASVQGVLYGAAWEPGGMHGNMSGSGGAVGGVAPPNAYGAAPQSGGQASSGFPGQHLVAHTIAGHSGVGLSPRRALPPHNDIPSGAFIQYNATPPTSDKQPTTPHSAMRTPFVSTQHASRGGRDMEQMAQLDWGQRAGGVPGLGGGGMRHSGSESLHGVASYRSGSVGSPEMTRTATATHTSAGGIARVSKGTATAVVSERSNTHASIRSLDTDSGVQP